MRPAGCASSSHLGHSPRAEDGVKGGVAAERSEGTLGAPSMGAELEVKVLSGP